MNFKFNIIGVDEGETKLNCNIEFTDVDAATAIQMMKRLESSPEQIKEVITTAYECFGAEQKRQFDARMQLDRDEFEYRKERDAKDDFYKKQCEEITADRDKLREENRQLKDKVWMMESGLETK